MLVEQVRLFARYNAWANRRLAAAIQELGEAAYRRDGGAFFKSVHGTWNHLLVADRIWFHRFGVAIPTAEQPTALDQILYTDRRELLDARVRMDALILDFAAQLDAGKLEAPVAYATTKGERFAQPLWQLLAHVVNHQTHHRGQVHALLTGLGCDAPALDLLYYLREPR